MSVVTNTTAWVEFDPGISNTAVRYATIASLRHAIHVDNVCLTDTEKISRE